MLDPPFLQYQVWKCKSESQGGIKSWEGENYAGSSFLQYYCNQTDEAEWGWSGGKKGKSSQQKNWGKIKGGFENDTWSSLVQYKDETSQELRMLSLSLFIQRYKVIVNNVVPHCQQYNQCPKCQVSGHKIFKCRWKNFIYKL